MGVQTNLAESKPHYQILDGLRGVAAIIVVMFHIMEAHSGGDHTKQILNHGYLAVDFFFLLSGFVISYAYDDRWNTISLKDFFMRRIVRLHPMIIVGSVIGALGFYFQHSPALGWGEIANVPVWKMLMVMLIGCTLFPVGKGLDIRGWGEMHPLNGPAWSLFFEYLANIAYALVLRRLSNLVLFIMALIAAGFTLHHALTGPTGDMVGGWTIDDPAQLKIGFIRLTFPFLAGILLARLVKFRPVANAFPIAAGLLIVLLVIPRIGEHDQLWQNGLYEALSIFILFPFIIWLGAGGAIKGERSKAVCNSLGDISYPIYITHYPLIYIYTAWVANNKLSFEQSWPQALLTLVAALALAYVTMKWIDIPAREWLRKKVLMKKR